MMNVTGFMSMFVGTRLQIVMENNNIQHNKESTVMGEGTIPTFCFWREKIFIPHFGFLAKRKSPCRYSVVHFLKFNTTLQPT